MATSMEQIKGWFLRGKEKDAAYMIVICDTFDWTDFPMYISAGRDIHDAVKTARDGNMQSVMEVYNLELDMESQLAEHRAFNY